MQSGKKSNIEASVKHSGVLIAEAIDCFGKNKKNIRKVSTFQVLAFSEVRGKVQLLE